MTAAVQRDITNDDHWSEFAHQWLIRPDTTYLNHGSFGPPSQYVKQRRRQRIDTLDCQPMDYYERNFESDIVNTRSKLADFVGTQLENLVLVENATFAMNVIADSFPLAADDEVLLNNHEYGAVHRIWKRSCERVGAKTVNAQLPDKFESKQQIIDCLIHAVTEKTKLLVVSHITSATAIVMPAKEIIAAFKERGIAVVVDGPHAPAQIELDIAELDCDFYAASCHKWLSATLGSGFLFAAPKWHEYMQPQLKSWGRIMPNLPKHWTDEFSWSGTRDPSAFLSIGDAIEFLQNEVGLDAFRQRTRFLAAQAESILTSEFGTETLADRDQGWYASMTHIALPPGHDFETLQQQLWQEYKIEAPVTKFENKWYIRVSFHLYNNQKQIETLKFAINKFLT